ncbi:SNF2 family N-terminal domain-containing protein [Suillus bovinus]|uniref:SNF2 family N-terminal domain-containing protein n=1 Tax=Suillus bovinus TaxID=48563 RepID=UPI001B881EED|nr:SNF2 family N-terminal domain-containing protein [Suillus bovinus]KAG2151182.1 SNF2 family N-terminal domain-containing protein [Suillus bovinus]
MDASTLPHQPDILAIAREQLGLQKHAKDASIPKSYLTALRRHLDIDPYDTNFRVTLQPKTGYGVITCLEQACATINIPLNARSGRSDGKAEGFGSLANYAVHASIPKHKQARLLRVKTLHAKNAIKNETPNVHVPDIAVDTKPPRGGLLAQLDANLNVNSLSSTSASAPRAPSLRAFVSLPLGRKNAGTAIKPEPTDAVIPRKRTSSSLMFLGAENEEDKSGVSTLPISKRTILHLSKAPVNSNTQPSQGHNPVQLADQKAVLPVAHQPSLHRSSDETHLRIANIQNNLSSLAKLSKLTKDRTVDQGTSAMISLVPRHNGDNAGYSYPTFNRQPIASGSHVRLSVAMGLDTDLEDDWELPNIFSGAGTHDTRFDEDGDFYGRGKDSFIGPTANPGDINKFLIAAGNAEQFDGNASVDKALEKLGLKSLYNFLPGMAISLLAHQVIGVAWALEREKSGDKGGCLSDEMGLGKTVQIISVIVANPSNDPRCKTNLIVAPLALLEQWKLEIEMKTTNNLKCLIYHGSNKPRKKTDLMKYDVVLTTYHTLALEWPDSEAEEKAKQKAQKRQRKTDSFIESDSGGDKKPKKKKRELGLLFQVQWYRVILDEAQNIRNRRTRISRSVIDLDTIYRWCLTGTPIINGLVDAYALFRFLRFRPWYDWHEFNGHVSIIERKNPELASKRLQAIFISIMLRRKKDSMLDGKRLIELPTKHVEMEKLDFSKEEREIYQMVEARSQAKFNRFLRAGTVLKYCTISLSQVSLMTRLKTVLVMLLRLRQVCSHPALIQETSEALLAADQLDGGHDLKAELTRAARVVSSDFVTKLKAKYFQCALARIQAEKESLDATADGEECPICMDAFTEARITACGHTFCRECVASVLNTPFVQDAQDPRKYRSNEKPCPSCRAPISADVIFIREAFEPTDTELSGDILASSDDEMPEISEMILQGSKGKGGARRIRKKRAVCDSDDESEDDDDDDMSDFIVEDGEDEEEKDARRNIKKRLRTRRAIVVESDDELDADERDVVIGRNPRQVPASTGEVRMMSRFLPSTKMNHMIEHLEKWAKQYPGDKTIIISQWTECLKLVSDFLVEKKVPHVKYQGSMSRSQRDQAVRVFMTGNTAQVMLMSLKCGGVGLNLTRANRVISLDLGWSEAIESQAFDRVHRLGQQKDVFVHRLVIANTVEDRVLALQERKRNLADGSLGEGSGKKIGRKYSP